MLPFLKSSYLICFCSGTVMLPRCLWNFGFWTPALASKLILTFCSVSLLLSYSGFNDGSVVPFFFFSCVSDHEEKNITSKWWPSYSTEFQRFVLIWACNGWSCAASSFKSIKIVTYHYNFFIRINCYAIIHNSGHTFRLHVNVHFFVATYEYFR